MLYLVDGVCHQAANRFIFPVSGDFIIKGYHPKGYCLSCFLYTKLGLNYCDWYKNTLQPVMEKYNNYIEDDSAKEIERLQNSASEIFDHYSISFDQSKIRTVLQFWLSNISNIPSKYGFSSIRRQYNLSEETVRNFAAEIIDLQRKTFSMLREAIGEDSFRLINDGDTEIKDIADIDSAIRFYCKK